MMELYTLSAGVKHSDVQWPAASSGILLRSQLVNLEYACRVGLKCNYKSRRSLAVCAAASSTACPSLKFARPENVPGEFFVDHNCIDCDACRWMSPKTFNRVGEQSAVYHQPITEEERRAALQALLSCPVSAIHTQESPADILQVQATFPLPINEESLPGVYHCGYHSKKAFGAVPYFIRRSGGNILIDSPRYTEQLARQLDKLGGVQYMFLSHRDDVADHARWHKRYHCTRILHTIELQPTTADVEIKLEGTGPWDLGPEIDLIFTPGHTEGCVSLLYKPFKALFAGDHLAAHREGGLHNLRDYNWYSVRMQIDSTRLLLPLDFVWVLPGHGRRIKFTDVDAKNTALQKLIDEEEEALQPQH
ncbi:hypothetical protein O6H91_Y037800 [Diphasiastrum complanatum]|nr:hypothetical protein O6H91_Y037800 [Diphasiastrum complanatum]